MPRVSVIIPSYNHEKYIAEAIQSVLDQTYQDFEIVITDDGSSDNTVNVIKSFTDPRISFFCFPQNQGAAVATNHCLKEAKGEFIALLNSDDVFIPHKLEKQVKFLDEHQEIGAVFSYARIINEESNDKNDQDHFYQKCFLQSNRTRFEWLNYFFFNLNCFCHPSILIRKQCYKDVGLYDQRLAQLPDCDFFIRLLRKYEVFIMPEKLVKFRILRNEANASGNREDVRIRTETETAQVFKQYLSKDILDNLDKIFPGCEQLNIQDNEREIINRFYLAKISLSHERLAVQHFGIDIFFNLLDTDNQTIKILKEKYDFDYKDLLMITKKYEIFSDRCKRDELEEVQKSKFWKMWRSWLLFKQYIGLKSLTNRNFLLKNN